MAFYTGLRVNSLPVNTPERVANFLIDNRLIPVLCFPETGSVFIDGRIIPQPMSIGKSLEHVIGQPIYDIDITTLTFHRPGFPERLAYTWERRTFLHSHWKPLAQNKIYTYCEIQLDDKNESI